MGPGPSDVHPKILTALSCPTIGHLDPQFVDLMDSIKTLLQYAFKTKNALTIPISAPGSAGMEACFANLVEPDDTVIVCINGVFGMRMLENVKRMRAKPVIVEDDWGQPVDPQKVEDACKQHPEAKIVAFVHAETSTGARSDAKTICSIAQKHNCLTIVDAVTSLGGIDVDVDAWGVDAMYSGTQKCLSSLPGLSPVTFSDKAIACVQGRKSPVQSWFLDLNLILGYWGDNQTRAYHHTAPINALYALHASLESLKEEGLENAFCRHEKNHLALRAGLQALGLSFLVDEQWRLPQLNSVHLPEGTDDAAVRSYLLNTHNLEIGAGLGKFAGKLWRIGLMGTSCNMRNVMYCLSALSLALKQPTSTACNAALSVYAEEA